MVVKLPEPPEKVAENLLRLANFKIPEDIGWALESAAAWESNPTAASQLAAILENVRKAEHLSRPMCQDTGIPIFWVRGRFDSSIAKDIAKAVENCTRSIPMRPNTVDVITRVNNGNNLGKGMPEIHFIPTDDDFTEITVLLKGAGSENMTKLKMLNPSDGEEGIRKFIIDSVLEAGGRPCPPGIVGVGIGGTSDDCVAMAKRALLEPLDYEDPDPEIRKMEEDLFVEINQSGLGPMGLGGNTTVLGVKIRKADCHTASLPVCVNIGCWATRRASAKITDSDVEYSQGAVL
ncbi:hydro-lyase, Fe-S type, tartrate/fumarate subfamily, alpha region [Thermoplasmatales archaeon BRNA1]|nr:hydro-lyase, Fe-S type, tartrate/fumarate subfamily, alpha region [Thermoplasmatales archaeon BRNA1]